MIDPASPQLLPVLPAARARWSGPAPLSSLHARALEAHLCAEPAPRALSELWQELVTGRVVVVDHFCRHQRCWVIVSDRSESEPLPASLNERDVRILTRLLLGDAQKVVAMDLCLATSSITLAASQCAHAMGVKATFTRIPTLLVAAAHAHHARADILSRQAAFTDADVQLRVLSIDEPSTSRALPLTTAERAIVALLVERLTNADVAAIRGCSARTVANQVSTLFRKFRVGTRVQLIARLLTALSEPSIMPALE